MRCAAHSRDLVRFVIGVGGLFGVILASPATAIVHVPGDAATIQGGINIAVPPDTVVVAAGVYNEHIQLRSRVDVYGSGADVTFIEGGGAAIDVVRAVSVTQVTFRGFTVRGAVSGGSLPGGAGVFVNLPTAPIRIEGIRAAGNDFGIAVFNGYAHSGPDIIGCEVSGNNFYGINDPGNGLITGCVIYGNTRAGIRQYGNSASAQIIGNTIWGNLGDGYDYWNDFAATVRNNIFAENGSFGIRERAPGTFVDPIVQYNLFWDNAAGNYYDVQSGTIKNTAAEINAMPNAHANLVDDPLLCDPPADFRLCEDSPAVGAGMGGADIGALGVGCGPCGPMAVREPASGRSAGLHLYGFPNPAPGTMTMTFTLAAGARVVLRVHDAQGRVVRTLLDQELTAGEHQVPWDGRDQSGTTAPAGTYLLDLRAGDLEIASKVLVLGGR
jgi:hypothetical protein